MKRRIAISALVGFATFVVVFSITHWAWARPAHHSPVAGLMAMVEGLLLGMVNAVVAFGVATVLKIS